MIPFNIKSPSFHQSQGRIIVVFIIILRTIVIIVIGKGRIRCFVQVRLVVVRFILCKWKGRLCFLLVERQTSVALRTVHCTGSILLRGSNEGYILYICRLYIYIYQMIGSDVFPSSLWILEVSTSYYLTSSPVYLFDVIIFLVA